MYTERGDMMNEMNQYVKNHVLCLRDLKDAPFSNSSIYYYIQKYHMKKVGPGIYIMPDCLEDKAYTLLLRCPQAVISHDDALYHYGLVDKVPLVHSFTIYNGYNTFMLRRAGYRAHYVKKELLDMGKVIVENHFGHRIPMYDLDRTICDMIRLRYRYQFDDYYTILEAYMDRTDKNLDNLLDYAKAFRVEHIVSKYMELLL